MASKRNFSYWLLIVAPEAIRNMLINNNETKVTKYLGISRFLDRGNFQYIESCIGSEGVAVSKQVGSHAVPSVCWSYRNALHVKGWCAIDALGDTNNRVFWANGYDS